MSRENTSNPKSTSESPRRLSLRAAETPSKVSHDSAKVNADGNGYSISTNFKDIGSLFSQETTSGLQAPIGLSYLGSSRQRTGGVQHSELDSTFNSLRKLPGNHSSMVDEIKRFNATAGGLALANRFAAMSSIPDLLANVDRTLEPLDPLDPLQKAEGGDNAFGSTSFRLNDHDLRMDLNLMSSARDLGKDAPEVSRRRGLSIADIHLLNEAWESSAGGSKERNTGSSVLTLNSGGIRRKVRFEDEAEEYKNVLHGPTGDGNNCHKPEDDDESIELEGGIFSGEAPADDDDNGAESQDNDDMEEDAPPLEPDISMAFPPGMVYDNLLLEPALWTDEMDYNTLELLPLHKSDASSTKKAALGLAKELRRMSLSAAELVITDTSEAEAGTGMDSVFDPDMVGGLPAWEFRRAGLSRFVTVDEVEQQEALLEAYEQGLDPKSLEEGQAEEAEDDESDSDDGPHIFVFNKVEPRNAAVAAAASSSSGAKRGGSQNGGEENMGLEAEEVLEGTEEEDDELTLEEQEQLEMAMAMSLEDLKQQHLGKGKGRAN